MEFALLLPLVLLMLFGIIDFGRALNAQITITQAAREGARLGALGVAAATVVTKTQAAAVGLTPVPAVNTGTACPVNAAAGVNSTVIVTYTFSYLTPVAAIAKMFGNVSFGASTPLTAQCVMPCET